MPEPRVQPKIFTLEEANAVLPAVRKSLATIRHHITRVLSIEARVDALELVTNVANQGCR